jgi:hypothetical protein
VGGKERSGALKAMPGGAAMNGCDDQAYIDFAAANRRYHARADRRAEHIHSGGGRWCIRVRTS